MVVNKMVKLNGLYSPTDSIKGFIPQIKAEIVANCDRKCKTCEDMNNGFCSIIFEE